MGLGCTPPGVAHRPNRNGRNSGAWHHAASWNKKVRLIWARLNSILLTSTFGILYVAYVCFQCVCVCEMFVRVWTQCDKLYVQNRVYLFEEVQKKKAFHEYNKQGPFLLSLVDGQRRGQWQDLSTYLLTVPCGSESILESQIEIGRKKVDKS